MSDVSLPTVPVVAPVAGDSVVGERGGTFQRFPVDLLLMQPGVGPVAPANPTAGKEWFNPNTGKKYTWVEDGTSGQWVEGGGQYFVDDPVSVAAAVQAKNDAQTARTGAEAAKASVDVGALTASNAAAAAAGIAKLYGSTALAVADAALALNSYFTTTSTVLGEAAILWQKTAGGAVDTGLRFPSTGLVPQVLLPESGYVWALVDQVGRAAMLVRDDGTVYPQKIVLPAASVATSMLDAATTNRLVGEGMGPMFQPIFDESGYLYAVTDANGRLIFGIPTGGGAVDMLVKRAQTSDNGNQANASYVAFPYIDGSGKRQIRSIRRSDGKVFAPTSVGNNYDPFLTADNRVLHTSDASGTPVRRWVAADASASGPLIPLRTIYSWGDSMSQNTFQAALAAALGVTVSAQGIASQTSGEIMARQGGVPALLTVTGNQIPASGALVVTAWSEDFLASKNTPTDTRSMTGTLAGVPGTLTKTGSPSTYSFARTAAGSVVACPPNTPFVPDLGVTARECINIIHAGTNDVIYGGSAVGLQTNVNAGVAYSSAFIKQDLVIGPFNRAGQTPGGAQFQMVIDMEASLAANAAANGYAFFNLRRYLIDNAATVAAAIGVTLTAQDATDIGNDLVPTSFRTDTTHLTAAVNNYVGGTILTNHINSLGWLGA